MVFVAAGWSLVRKECSSILFCNILLQFWHSRILKGGPNLKKSKNIENKKLGFIVILLLSYLLNSSQ